MGQPFTKVIDLLYLAKQNPVDIDLQEDQLQLKLPRSKPVDKGFIEQLTSNKQQIIDFLNDCPKSSVRAVEKISRTKRNSNGHLPFLPGLLIIVSGNRSQELSIHPRIMVSRAMFRARNSTGS